LPDFTHIYNVYHGKQVCSYGRYGVYVPLWADRIDGDSIGERQTFEFLRAHYWVWKNLSHEPNEVVGFQHYRRCLFLPPLVNGENANSLPNVYDNPDMFDSYTNSSIYIPGNLYGYDFIVAKAWQFDISIGEEYCRSHVPEHWAAMLRSAPELIDYAKDCNSYNVCTMFITSRRWFEKFMSFWWRLMCDVVPRITIPVTGYQSRAIGFLSERIFGLWLKMQENEHKQFKFAEVPLLMDSTRKIPDNWELSHA